MGGIGVEVGVLVGISVGVEVAVGSAVELGVSVGAKVSGGTLGDDVAGAVVVYGSGGLACLRLSKRLPIRSKIKMMTSVRPAHR